MFASDERSNSEAGARIGENVDRNDSAKMKFDSTARIGPKCHSSNLKTENLSECLARK